MINNILAMAEGGFDPDFGYEDPGLDHAVDHDDGDEQEINTDRPLQPGAASTPRASGEQIEMQTMSHEQSGLPDTNEDGIPLVGGFIHQDDKAGMFERAKAFIKTKFPRVAYQNNWK